jgi:hypothetical protein
MENETKKQVENINNDNEELLLSDVSQQRELLIDFIKWLRKDYEVEDVYEMYADEYLQEKSINCG